MTQPNPWEQDIIDNAVEYSIVEWRPLNKTTKTIKKFFKRLYQILKLLSQMRVIHT